MNRVALIGKVIDIAADHFIIETEIKIGENVTEIGRFVCYAPSNTMRIMNTYSKRGKLVGILGRLVEENGEVEVYVEKLELLDRKENNEA